MWSILWRGAGVSCILGLQAGHFTPLQSDWRFFMCPSQQCTMLEGCCPPCRAGGSCSPSLPFQQLGRSGYRERNVACPFKASWANRQDKYENISLKITALTLQLTLTHVTPKQLSEERMGNSHCLPFSILSAETSFPGILPIFPSAVLEMGPEQNPRILFPSKMHICIYKIHTCICERILVYHELLFAPLKSIIKL